MLIGARGMPLPHHLDSDSWQSLLRGFARPGYSVFDAAISQLLCNIPIKGKSVVQIGCNNGREVLSAMSLGADRALGIDQSAEFLKQAEV